MEGREIRRSVTLSEQLSINDSSSLGDLLKLREEEAMRLSRCDPLTLESAIGCEKGEYSAATGVDDSSGRTLLDVILQENEASRVAADGDSSDAASWKTLRDRFRLQSDGAAAASPGQLLPISNPDPVDSGLPTTVLVSPSPSRSNLNSELAAPEPTVVAVEATSQQVPSADGGSEVINVGEESNPPSGAAVSPIPAAAAQEEVEEPARVSLMVLLEQTDRQWSGSERERFPMAAAAAETVVEAEAEGESGGGAMSYMCCVCMVRHRGAAFIPCGHTFCRICSRELWISRGSCPLCNREIVEILNIF